MKKQPRIICQKIKVSARHYIFNTNPHLIRHCEKLLFKESQKSDPQPQKKI